MTTAIDGWPVELADTAGLRDAEDELESAGIELTAQTLAGADLVIVVHDSSEPLHDSVYEPVSEILEKVSIGPRVIRVLNKIDLLAETHAGLVKTLPLPPGEGRGEGKSPALNSPSPYPLPKGEGFQCGREPVVATSALTGEGIAELIAAIGRALVPRAPEPGFAVPFMAEQVAALEAARAAVAAHNAAASLTALQPLLACDSVSG
jgi:tRNA modification GTPase